ncbi:PEP-CTERM sorting domain-containing protein [Roseibacillus persicicus]|uniref:PEP-CTERM sorting domain-containing protein n=1 Tax=Roseibacillus persicicus TaxID=454148 RepID=UPI00281060BC|nr:PEP-CTERM sorting domain-containing protein [Roseibacillus persicicus]MDQ8189035.1 PEP-CTERM sorting domain-containing protein [Roseibacillus persicicus]
MKHKYRKTATFAGVLLTSIAAHADTFTGDGDGTSWEDPDNWLGDSVPASNASNILIVGDSDVTLDAGTWSYLESNNLLHSSTEYRLARLLMGESNAGADSGTHTLTLDQGVGNTIRATNSSSANVGTRANKHSILNIMSGTTNLEAGRIVVGSAADSSGTINVNGGDLILGRGGLELGFSGTGTINITAGSFINRNDVEIFGGGTFHVAGSAPITIGIGSSASLDGNWEQAGGGVLRTGIDAGGMTTILIDDVDDDGAGLQGNATFAAGSILDPYDLGGATPDIWHTVMTWEGTVTGAPTLSVDAVNAGWMSQISGNNLQVQLTSIPEPSAALLGGLALIGLGLRRRRD